jgi:hypothetical protein
MTVIKCTVQNIQGRFPVHYHRTEPSWRMWCEHDMVRRLDDQMQYLQWAFVFADGT